MQRTYCFALSKLVQKGTLERESVNDKRMNTSIFWLSPTQTGTTKILTEQWDYYWGRTSNTLLGTSLHFSKGIFLSALHIPQYDFFPCPHLSSLSLPVWKTRFLFLYLLPTIWSHKANYLVSWSLIWDNHHTQSCLQDLTPAPCLFNSEITPETSAETHIFSSRWGLFVAIQTPQKFYLNYLETN